MNSNPNTFVRNLYTFGNNKNMKNFSQLLQQEGLLSIRLKVKVALQQFRAGGPKRCRVKVYLILRMMAWCTTPIRPANPRRGKWFTVLASLLKTISKMLGK